MDPDYEAEKALRYALFDQLRKLWSQADEARTFAQLSELLGTTAPQVTQWATGSGRSPAPWPVIFALAADLQVLILLDPDEPDAKLIRAK